jgi:hypothetical protein
MSEDQADAPEDHSVSAAADAIAELMKKPPAEEADGEDKDDAPAPQTPAPEKPDAPDPQVEAVKADAARKGGEAERTRAHLAGMLNTLVPQLETAIKGEFGDIRSPADLARIARDDPARYNRFIAFQGQHAQASAARSQLQRAEHENVMARQAAWQKDETAKAGTMVPDLTDRDKGPALANRIQAFAIKSGYSPQQLALASANDIAMLHRAMQYEGLEAAKETARAKAAKAPRVSEPGTRGEGGKSAKLQSDFERLKKSGRTEDAAAVFRNLIT